MGNGRPMFLHVTVKLTCAGCGADLSRAIQHRGQHPKAGQSVLDGRGARLVEGSDGRQKKVTATCGRCGARPQRRWDAVVDRLNSLDENGEHTAVLPI